MARKLTVLFIPLDGYGHLHACVGVAQQLHKRGHRVIMALERAWNGKASKHAGIEEVNFVDATRDENEEANEFWIKFMKIFKSKFSLPPYEALKKLDLELEKLFLFTLMNVDDQLVKIIEQCKPDVIVADTYVTIPAVYKSNIPWVLLISAGPLCVLDSEDLPPHRTGYPTNGDRRPWEEYRKLDEIMGEKLGVEFFERLAEYGIDPPEDRTFLHHSPYLNMYAYPKELDYIDIRPLPDKWKRFDNFVRFEPKGELFEFPEKLAKLDLGKLVYVSMGTLGCADEELMQRLLDICSKSPNRFIFSLGACHDKLKLYDNIWGQKFVPQMKILPLVDLVISHGGNNTFGESFYFGKPQLIAPLFGDQLDNAQRITELGYGDRFNPYHDEQEVVLAKIENLLYNKEIQQRVLNVSKRIQVENSPEKAAIAIEEVVDV